MDEDLPSESKIEATAPVNGQNSMWHLFIDPIIIYFMHFSYQDGYSFYY